VIFSGDCGAALSPVASATSSGRSPVVFDDEDQLPSIGGWKVRVEHLERSQNGSSLTKDTKLGSGPPAGRRESLGSGSIAIVKN
jgi:hypothetical protein